MLTLSAATVSYAQTARATLTGVVTDPTGAVVANVPVKATHVETGTTIIGTTSDTGNYSIPQLPVGAYEITVQQPGFKAFHRTGLTLGSAQVLRLDVALEVGAASESVTVSAEASLVQTDSGTLIRNITPQQIQNLPVLPVGTFIRDPLALAYTLPGSVNQSGSGFAPRMNGLPQASNQYRVDGEVVTNTGAATITTRNNVSPDAVQEIAIQTSNFNAEYGSVSGALFNITIKSGTNQYHGTVYDYAVNEILNAQDPTVHLKNRVRRHDYGFNVGGPVRIPFLYNGTNKTFFFFNWEQYRDKQLNNTGFTVPTVPIQAYRDGDFSNLPNLAGTGGVPTNLRLSATTGANPVPAHDYVDPLGRNIVVGTIFDPTSTQFNVPCNTAISGDCGANGTLLTVRNPYPNNKIPLTQQDKVALAIQSKYIPLPKGPNATNNVLINNYFNPFYTQRVTRSPSIKIDQNITSKGRVSFTWTDNHTESPYQSLGLGEGFLSVISGNGGTYEASPTYRMNFDYNLQPTMILHLGVGWQEFNFSNRPLVNNYDAAADIGFTGPTLKRNFPRLASTVVAAPALGGMNTMGPPGQADQPERHPSASANLTWIRGNHSFKFGGDWRKDFLVQETYNNTNGTVNSFGGATAGIGGNGITWQPALTGLTGFTGGTTVGFPYANYLLGSVTSATLSVPIEYRRTKQQWGTYIQDTWRVRRT